LKKGGEEGVVSKQGKFGQSSEKTNWRRSGKNWGTQCVLGGHQFGQAGEKRAKGKKDVGEETSWTRLGAPGILVAKDWKSARHCVGRGGKGGVKGTRWKEGW